MNGVSVVERKPEPEPGKELRGPEMSVLPPEKPETQPEVEEVKPMKEAKVKEDKKRTKK